MKRFATGHKDDNHAQIASDLEATGVSVVDTSGVGNGFGDIVAGWRGVNYILEVKDPTKKPSARKLTKKEVRFHTIWKGQRAVVETSDQAFAVLGIKITLGR